MKLLATKMHFVSFSITLLFMLWLLPLTKLYADTVNTINSDREDVDISTDLIVDKSAWDSANNPSNINEETSDQAFEYNFNRLPINGSLGYQPWSDNYWPNSKGGLTYRWHSQRGFDRFRSAPSNKRKAMRMSMRRIAALSPAEKYDIFTGRFDYPLTRAERARTAGSDEKWEGICHGLAPASFLFKEPKPVTLRSVDGILIPFGSSDIKGLLSLLQGEYNKNGKNYYAGNRCNEKFNVLRDFNRSNPCLDVNAGAFHVILSNRLGILHRGLVMDKATNIEIWNHALLAYTTKVISSRRPSRGAARSTVKELVVSTILTYTLGSAQSFYPNDPARRKALRQNKEYRYILELDSDRNIVGGKWISSDYPDFLWIQDRATFTSTFEALEEIYRRSIEYNGDIY
ncbi:MAG: hypothetical protein HQK51_02050 [Oligoflexia bacterium]|nr:hypothetical protein [Oligoflexia bacterium]